MSFNFDLIDESKFTNVKMPELSEMAPNLMANAAKAGGGEASKTLLGEIGPKGGAIIDAGMGFLSSGADVASNAFVSKGDRMSDRGEVIHKTDTAGNVLKMGAAGAKLGSVIPGVGNVAGALGGALIGGAMSIIGNKNKPTQDDILQKHADFDMGLMTGMIRNNDTLPEQKQEAEKGMKKVAGTKDIEVEKDEIILRKTGNSFTKVADFKGGKTHEQGGEDYTAMEGDIIFPGNKRYAVEQALRTRDWKKLESMRQMLPADTKPEYSTGTDGIKTEKPTYDSILLPISSDPIKQEDDRVAYAVQKGLSVEQLGAFEDQIVADREYGKTRQKFLQDYTKKWRSEKTGVSPNANFSQISPEYRAMVKAREQAWTDAGNKRTLNPIVEEYYKTGPAHDPNFLDPVEYARTRALNNAELELGEPKKYKKGTKGVKTDEETNAGWTAEMVEDYIQENVAPGKTPAISGEKLLELANKHDFPIELALVQGAVESNFGTKGAGSWTNNIFNWGNVTEGDNQTRAQALKEGNRRVMDSVVKGVETYMKGVKKNYLKNGDDWQALLQDGEFVNKDGNRYATTPQYEKMLNDAAQTLPNIEPQYGPQRLSPEEEAASRAAARTPEQRQFEAELAAGDMPYWNINTPRGKAIADYKRGRNIAARNASAPGLTPGAGLAREAFVRSNVMERFSNLLGSTDPNDFDPQMVDEDGKVILDEIGYENSERGQQVKEELNNFFANHLAFEGGNILKKSGTFLLSGAESFNALKDYVLTGQNTGAATPNAIGNLASWFDPQDYQKIIDEAIDQGVLSPWSAHIAKDAYNNPEDWYTTDTQTGFAFDVATILANPRGLYSLGKSGLRLLRGTGKTGMDATKALWHTLKNASPKDLKKVPGMVKKGVDQVLATGSKFGNEATIDDILAIQKNVKGMPLSDDAVNKLTRAERFKTFLGKVPNKLRKNYTGKSYSEISKLSDDIERMTGRTFDELNAMTPKQIKETLTSSVAESAQRAKTARANVTRAENNLQKAQRQLDIEADNFAKANPNATPEQLAELEETLAPLRAELTRSKSILDDAMNFEKTAQENIYRWQNAVGQQLDDIPAELKAAIKEEYDFAATRFAGKKDNVAAATDKLASAQEASKLADEAASANSIESLKARLKDFPETFRALEKDSKILNEYLNGTRTLAQVLTTIEHAPRTAPNDKLMDEIEAIRKSPDSVEAPDAGPQVSGRSETSVNEGIEATGIVADTDFDLPEINTGASQVDLPEGDDKKFSIGDVAGKIGGGLEALAQYAPALYNITKGLQKPDKVKRNFVRPQTLRYEDVSDPQRNLIDTAFNAAIENSRNLSGGLMSNFRANTEAAWAERIARRGQVDAAEVARNMEIANANVGIRNRAEEINTETKQRADIMDMQSKAATNSFLAQGINDVANIAQVRTRDRNAEKNQDIMLNAINSGRDFQIQADGTIVYKGLKTPSFNPDEENLFRR